MKSPLAQHLLAKYGPRLTMRELAEALRLSYPTVRNRQARGELGVKTYIDGKHRYADYRDVANYLENFRESAQT